MLSSVAMNLSKVLVCISVLLINLCFARVSIDTSKSDEFGLIEAVVQIAESCYGNRTTAVGLAGSSTGTISRALWARGNASITLIDGTTRIESKNSVNLQRQYKLQVFVITASSPITLKKILDEIKASIWWNHMANFLLLDLNHGCTNAFELLWTAWEMNALNAKLLCYHRTNGRLIYTFNPYSSHAPDSWQFDKTYSGKNNHPWTLFVRVYEDGERLCNELDYDKTADLGGYEIRLAVVDDGTFSDGRNNSGTICFNLFDDIVCQVIFHALNATPNVQLHSSLDTLGYADDKGNVNGILKDIFDDLTDVGIGERYLTSLGKVPHAYPHYLNGLRSVTQYSGYKSQLSKIYAVIDSRSRVSLCVVCLITVLFFKYFMRQSVAEAHLSTFRIICNTCLPTVSGKLAPRIYLGSLFLFALTMQGIYQGKLASLLTMQERLRDVNTMNDLAELGHTIYGYPSLGRYFSEPEFEGHFVGTETFKCTEYALDNPRAACVFDESLLMDDAVKYNLHMSNEVLVPIWAALPVRPDWPLQERIGMVLRTAIEAQGLLHSVNDVMYETFRHLQAQENRYKEQGSQVLTLGELGFAFAILGIGLGCATISFFVEVILGRKRPRTAKSRIAFAM